MSKLYVKFGDQPIKSHELTDGEVQTLSNAIRVEINLEARARLQQIVDKYLMLAPVGSLDVEAEPALKFLRSTAGRVGDLETSLVEGPKTNHDEHRFVVQKAYEVAGQEGGFTLDQTRQLLLAIMQQLLLAEKVLKTDFTVDAIAGRRSWGVGADFARALIEFGESLGVEPKLTVDRGTGERDSRIIVFAEALREIIRHELPEKFPKMASMMRRELEKDYGGKRR